MNVEVKPSEIVLKEDLNRIGTYSIDIKFHTEVSAKVSIKIDKIQSS
jgi:ribosomal protein L9